MHGVGSHGNGFRQSHNAPRHLAMSSYMSCIYLCFGRAVRLEVLRANLELLGYIRDWGRRDRLRYVNV